MKFTVTKEINGEDVPILFLQTDHAVASDYLAFVGGAIELLRKERGDLEREANANGRTITHPYEGVGSQRVEVLDE